MKKTRIQMRGTCTICGKLHALKGEYLVSHGYTLRFGGQSNICYGADAPHYGSEKAPAYIESVIAKLYNRIESLPELIEKYDGKRKRELQRELRELPASIETLKERVKQWKKSAPIELDIDVEEAKAKEQREIETKRNATAKAKAAEEKESKRIEREAKAKKKWAEILATNYHAVELDSTVIAEWTTEYPARKELENSHYDALVKYFDDNGINDPYDRMGIAERVIHRVRKASSKGKQLHKF